MKIISIKLFVIFKYYIYICRNNYNTWGCHRIDSQSSGSYAGVGLSNTRLINQMAKVVNGKTNEVGTREDLVAALNGMKVETLELV